jgi:hypothetical protein
VRTSVKRITVQNKSRRNLGSRGSARGREEEGKEGKGERGWCMVSVQMKTDNSTSTR